MKSFRLLLLLLPVQLLYAQNDATKDSLLAQLSLAKEDTNKVLDLITIGQYVEYNNLEEAKHYYRQAYLLSKKLNYPMGVLKYYSNYTAVLNIQARFDSALMLTMDAVQLATKFGNEERIIIAQQNLSATYSYQQDYEQALQYLLPSIAYFEKTKNDARLSLVYDNLGIIYRETKQYDKALKFHKKALDVATRLGNFYDIANVLSNLGNAYTSLKKYDSALSVMRQSLHIARKENFENIVSNNIGNIGSVLTKQGKYDSLLLYCTEGLQLSEKLGDSLTMVNNIYGLALYAFYQEDFNKCTALANKGFSMAQQRNYAEPQQLFAELLSDLALVKGDLNKYDYYNRMSISLSEIFFNENMQRNVQTLDKKFETEKKEKQLLIQQSSIRQKNTLIYIFLGGIAALLLISILASRNYKQKRKLQEQKIEDLEKEKLLLATKSLLKGQEDERSRLAKDLHDGLGGMLSGIKLTLGGMKGNMVLTAENARLFSGALQKLDQTISEMRRVAHSMMPEALLRLGLGQALSDYCDGLSENSAALTINYQQFGMEDRLPNDTEIVVYRIVQELLTNVLKHSEASEVLIQLMRQDNMLLLTVEDNGRGFDAVNIWKNKGSGLDNIQSRVSYLHGTLDVKSAPGKGCSFHIEIPLLS